MNSDSPALDAGSVYAYDLGFATPVKTTLQVNSSYVLANDALPAVASLTTFACRSSEPRVALQCAPTPHSRTRRPPPGRAPTASSTRAASGILRSNSANRRSADVAADADGPLGWLADPTLRRRDEHQGDPEDPGWRPIAGRSVKFEYLSGTKWVSLGSVVTGRNGTATKKVAALKSARKYRVRTDWSSLYGAAGSRQVRIAPHVTLSRPSRRQAFARDRALTVQGYLKPRHKAGTHPVKLYFYRSVSNRWVKQKVVSVTARNYRSYSKYTKSVKLSVKGTWKVRAYHPADKTRARDMEQCRLLQGEVGAHQPGAALRVLVLAGGVQPEVVPVRSRDVVGNEPDLVARHDTDTRARARCG